MHWVDEWIIERCKSKAKVNINDFKGMNPILRTEIEKKVQLEVGLKNLLQVQYPNGSLYKK